MKYEVFPELDSTNLEIKRRLAGHQIETGDAIVALTQTRGRGRQDRLWSSPPGGLYFSMLFQATAHRPPTDLSLLAAVSVANWLKAIGIEAHQINLKWPNDVLVDGKKVCGILSEIDSQGHVIVGIGVNLLTPEAVLRDIPARFPAGTLLPYLKNPISLESAGRQLQQTLWSEFDRYQTLGFGHVREAWIRSCQWVGKRLKVHDGERELTAVFEGIDPQGALVLRVPGGQTVTLLSAEILCCLP